MPIDFDSSKYINVIQNIGQNMPAVINLLGMVAYILGLMFAFKAIYSFKMYGEARTMMSSNTSMKEPLTFLCIAACLIYSQTAMEVFLASTFGSSSPMAYSELDVSNASIFTSSAGNAAKLIMQVIGLAAFIRGFVLLGRAAGHGQQPGGTGKGLMHIFGGVLAINIVGTLNIIDNTLYGT